MRTGKEIFRDVCDVDGGDHSAAIAELSDQEWEALHEYLAAKARTGMHGTIYFETVSNGAARFRESLTGGVK